MTHGPRLHRGHGSHSTLGLPTLGLPVFLGAALAGCAGEPEERAFVELLGSDTMAIEVFRRTADGLEGEMLARSPVTQVGHYAVRFAEDGSIAHFGLEWSTPPENPDGPAPASITIDVTGDSATIVRLSEGETVTQQVVASPHPVPTTGRFPLAVGLFEHAVQLALAGGSGEEPFGLTMLWPLRGRSSPNAISRRGPGEVSLDLFGNPLIARLDAEGRITSITGSETTMKVEIEPIDPPDVAVLAADFAARDARGEGVGTPSPGATVTESGGGATFEIAYSRPAMRGREIWGSLVPYGEVWRTGANAATQFGTDRDLIIGEVEVPAGSYTLWSTYAAESAMLIINSQTGQWGTQYDAAQDFVRVPMTAEGLEEPVDRFTISIEPTEDGGILQLSWDRTRFTVPMRVR